MKTRRLEPGVMAGLWSHAPLLRVTASFLTDQEYRAVVFSSRLGRDALQDNKDRWSLTHHYWNELEPIVCTQFGDHSELQSLLFHQDAAALRHGYLFVKLADRSRHFVVIHASRDASGPYRTLLTGSVRISRDDRGGHLLCTKFGTKTHMTSTRQVSAEEKDKYDPQCGISKSRFYELLEWQGSTQPPLVAWGGSPFTDTLLDHVCGAFKEVDFFRAAMGELDLSKHQLLLRMDQGQRIKRVDVATIPRAFAGFPTDDLLVPLDSTPCYQLTTAADLWASLDRILCRQFATETELSSLLSHRDVIALKYGYMLVQLADGRRGICYVASGEAKFSPIIIDSEHVQVFRTKRSIDTAPRTENGTRVMLNDEAAEEWYQRCGRRRFCLLSMVRSVIGRFMPSVSWALSQHMFLVALDADGRLRRVTTKTMLFL